MDEWNKDIKAKADLWFSTPRTGGMDTSAMPRRITHHDLLASIKLSSNDATLPNSSETEPATDSPTCDWCEGSGWVFVPDPHQPLGKALEECGVCRVVEMRRTERQAALQAERSKAALAELRRSMGRLADCTFANFDLNRPLQAFEAEGPDGKVVTISMPAQRKRLQKALEVVQTYAHEPAGRWLFLYGTPGGGKSHLAAAATNDIGAQGMTVACESVPDLLNFIKAGFEDNKGEERIQALCDADLLVLDDIGIENYEKSWTLETMFRILNNRSKHSKPTVFTSNNHPDRLPYRLSSRILELSEVVWMPIFDLRRLPR